MGKPAPARNALFLTALLLASTLAGCLGDSRSSGQRVSTTPPPTAPPPDVTTERGSISGRVVDDETLPVERASVALIETGVEVETDAAGAFTFNGLEPRTYKLIVTRVGYDQAVKKAEVRPGEVTNVTILVVAISFDEPYQRTVSKVAYLQATWIFATSLVWPRVNNSQTNALMCEPCRFTIHHDPTPTGVLTETLWLSGTTNQAVNNKVWIQYMRNITAEDGDGVVMKTGYWSHRQSMLWTEAQAKELRAIRHIELWVNGDLLGINFQHKVEVMTSFSYGKNFPEGFTALPPA